MKKKSKIISVIVVLLLSALIVASNLWRRNTLVRDVKVVIDYCGSDTLVTAKQTAGLIRAAMPGLSAIKLGDVDLEAVEKAASHSPYLRDCEAGTSIGGSVVLYAVQRRPIVRIVSAGEEYYLDDRCTKVPLSHVGSCDVVVASGNIPQKGKGLKDVYSMASYLDKHPDIAPLFDQIYRDGVGDVFLTPKLGNHVVQVGAVDSLDVKFHNLLALYKRGLPQAGWETYSMVSVKYRGQVVCTRRK